MRVDVITLPALILSNVLNIYGRQMTVTEYADSKPIYNYSHEFNFNSSFNLIYFNYFLGCTKQFLEKINEKSVTKLATLFISLIINLIFYLFIL